jgi:hypothetical protein
MEPQYPGQSFEAVSAPERMPEPITPENSPNIPTSPEAPIQSPEQAKSVERLAIDHQGNAPMLPVTPQPAIVQPVADDASSDGQVQDATVIATTPATASDNDTIEKEWIDKVKSVISSTASDPHRQQKYASQLMANYILKRYGRKIGEIQD